MIVLVLERVSPSLRGELTRWLLEPRAGVFVGTLSAEVRDRLWEKVCNGRKGGRGMLAYRAETEQGFALRTCGDSSREVIDYEGLALIKIPN